MRLGTLGDVTLVELILAGQVEGDAYDEALDAADASDLAAMLALADHPSPEVRRAMVMTLPLLSHGGDATAEMVDVAVRLTSDRDLRVRDYACFALGQQMRDADTLAVRDALAARLDDIDREARSEALLGLAYRRDPRALPRVREALSRPSGDLWLLELKAAGALGDPELHQLVLRHQSGWGQAASARVAEVVARLTDPNGPGADVLDGVAELYRGRARRRPFEEDLGPWQLMDEMLDLAPDRAGEFLAAVLVRLEGDEPAIREVLTNSALAQEAHELD